MTRKVVFNNCYGHFSLSIKAEMTYLKRKGMTPKCYIDVWGDEIVEVEEDPDFSVKDIPRHDPDLVAVVEELGEEASGRYTKLLVEEVDGPYRITEYDGSETVEEPNDITWL